ncbi:uncharacterized protein LOC112575477 [Pomacea canaliculata]|uniref:uncharacterized protein LOC112575477 n=1 Tax=Pomacea canaliculata TaxID=400727 RepID=UPI000D730B43|nr:uncharacterized protein LOC112575477 [Pomacea canaliculata]
MLNKLYFVLLLTVPPWLVQVCKTNISWVRDRTFDDIIRVTGYSQLVTPGQNKSAIHCGLLCTSMSWCSSFFFLSATGGCILHQTVFAVPQGGQGTKGARYYRAFTAGCPKEYVFVRQERLCFKVSTSRTVFQYAYGNCSRADSQLVVLDTPGKHSAVANYVAEAYSNIFSYFIGGVRPGVVDGTRSQWSALTDPLTWLTGALVSINGPDTFWASENPSNSMGTEGCMELNSGTWNDLSCNHTRAFICERHVT